jgi:hypothetical protein
MNIKDEFNINFSFYSTNDIHTIKDLINLIQDMNTEIYKNLESTVMNFADYLERKVCKGSVTKFVLEKFLDNFPNQFDKLDKRNYFETIK